MENNDKDNTKTMILPHGNNKKKSIVIPHSNCDTHHLVHPDSLKNQSIKKVYTGNLHIQFVKIIEITEILKSLFS